jgi:hypothetical protein
MNDAPHYYVGIAAYTLVVFEVSVLALFRQLQKSHWHFTKPVLVWIALMEVYS